MSGYPTLPAKSKLDTPIMVDRDKFSAKHLRAQQAKEFLISQIIEQARRDNVLLSEVEQKINDPSVRPRSFVYSHRALAGSTTRASAGVRAHRSKRCRLQSIVE